MPIDPKEIKQNLENALDVLLEKRGKGSGAKPKLPGTELLGTKLKLPLPPVTEKPSPDNVGNTTPAVVNVELNNPRAFGFIGHTFSRDLEVTVTDAMGQPVVGARVRFLVTGGDGKLETVAGGVDSRTGETTTVEAALAGGGKIARATLPANTWRLGSRGGDEITVIVANHTKAFKVKVGAVLEWVEPLPKDPGRAGVAAKPNAQVRLLDPDGKALTGEKVLFEKVGNGHLVDPGPPPTNVPSVEVLVGPDGIAKAPEWNVGAGAGPRSLTATFEGQQIARDINVP